MSEFVPGEGANVTIAVCGEQGAGKTVFLTCIFQSVWTAFSGDEVVSFDRTKVGNASYFQQIEDALLTNGPAPGTTDKALYPARIYVKPYEPLPDVVRPVLEVDIVDFAGRHFRSIADLKRLLAEAAPDAEETKALQEVEETLKRADAFVVLINAREIDPANPAPSRSPYSPSVRYILEYCRENKKPVALLFSQRDQVPALTDEVMREIPYVEKFQRDFTPDLREAAIPGSKPFGVVQRIACYETLPDELTPKRQHHGGNIWRLEPARIVLDLLRAAMPSIRARLEKEAAGRAAAAQAAEEKRRRNQRNLLLVAAAAVTILILVIAVSVFEAWRRGERRQVRAVESITEKIRAGDLEGAVPLLGGLDTIRSQSSPPSAVLSAIRDLESAASEAGAGLAGGPSLDPAYAKKIADFQKIVDHLDPAVTAEWEQSFQPVLLKRQSFFGQWLGLNGRTRRDRTRYLDASAADFSQQADTAFARLLTEQSTREKEEEVAAWQALIEADPDVATRLTTIQRIIASSLDDNDPEFARLARKALAGHVITAILERSENLLLRDKLLTPLAPALASMGNGTVRFDVLAQDLINCASRSECQQRYEVVQSVLTEAMTNTSQWSSAVENNLRSLLLDLPLESRKEVWQAVDQSLVRSYFFNGRSDAWPGGVEPLHADVAALAAAEEDRTLEIMARLAQQPLYASELRFLRDRLAATEARRRVVPLYSAILHVLPQQQSLLPSADLARIGQEISSTLNGSQPQGPLAEIAAEVSEVLGLVQSVNSVRARGTTGRTPSMERLERVLRNANRSHCTALASHEAPEECSNAA